MGTRVATAVAAGVPVLAALFWGDLWPLLLLAAVAALVASFELSAIARLKRRSVGTLAAVAAVAGVALMDEPSRVPTHEAAWGLLAALVLGVFFAASLRTAPGGRLRFELAHLWILAPLASLMVLKLAEGAGGRWNLETPLLLAVLPLWVGDSVAMLVGRKWGKTPLAPRISPKKSVEGGAANLAGCVATAAALGPWVGASWPAALGCGLTCGVLGQVGDLFQSSLKRAADLKDSGGILPGHGGLLDRIDSLLFAAPVAAVILTLPGAVAR